MGAGHEALQPPRRPGPSPSPSPKPSARLGPRPHGNGTLGAGHPSRPGRGRKRRGNTPQADTGAARPDLPGSAGPGSASSPAGGGSASGIGGTDLLPHPGIRGPRHVTGGAARGAEWTPRSARGLFAAKEAGACSRPAPPWARPLSPGGREGPGDRRLKKGRGGGTGALPPLASCSRPGAWLWPLRSH